MFAELKSNEDIQKSIVEYLGEDEKDTRRIKFYKIYDKIPTSFLTMVVLQLTTKLNTTMIFKCVFFIVVGVLYLKFASNMFRKICLHRDNGEDTIGLELKSVLDLFLAVVICGLSDLHDSALTVEE